MQILQNDSLSRILHNALYQRMVDFAKLITPELPAEAIVELWLRAFYDANNKNIYILVNLNDKYNITAHCVILIGQEAGYNIVYAHQLQDDKKSGTFLDECMEYVDKLKTATNAICKVANVYKGEKAMEKKYGFKKARSVIFG